MRAFIRVVQDIALLVVRLAVGFILMMHGYHRYLAGPSRMIEIIEDFGLPAAEALAWATIGFEVIGGLLLVFGLGTPIIGSILLAEQVVLIWVSKWDHGFRVMDGGYEYNVALAALGLVLMAFGSGRLGVDTLFGRPGHDPEHRFINDADPA